ncbi:DSD1 family PLP-dependent enzyme [Sphingomonas sp. 28-63-12]|uniref:DSD1 family PLP-dependent enzyme n=1 Tax=Sphingomonas sp. 28-63-12 TaxID=1970434 RepID=UPI0035A976C2
MSPTEAQARALIGEPRSRWRLPTPALILDLDRLEANIRQLGKLTAGHPVQLRPHAKSHKSSLIAAAQIAAGAVGICCAKLGEAEALAAAGIGDILVTSPIASDDVAWRAAALAHDCRALAVVVDHEIGLTALIAAAEAQGVAIDVLIDVDVGLGRTGVSSAAAALALARVIAQSPMLRLRGVQGYGGHWQHLRGADARLDAVRAGMDRLTDIVFALRLAGHPCPVISGGGTGTLAADLAIGVLTELQPGSYIFMDAQYTDALAADSVFSTSLFVQAQVVSVNAPAWVTVDAGLKAFAADGPMPRAVGPLFGDTSYLFFGDEHGMVSRPQGDFSTRPGERIEFVTPHCDPTVDRYDFFHIVRGDTLVAIEPIDAARRSQ